MDSKDVFRCYEIKVTKSDFHSNHGHNFVGNYNYYVMPKELFDEVKNEISKEIGCIALINNRYLECVKKPKRQELKLDLNILKSSMIRSLYRETEKARMSCDLEIINRYKTKISRLEKDKSKIYKELQDLRNKLYRHFGREGWHKLQELLDL